MSLLTKAVESTGGHISNSEKEVGELLASLIRMSKMTNVLESGVFKGRTSSYLIDALPPKGKFYGIDIEDHRTDDVKTLMEKPNCHYLLGDSREVIKKLPTRFFDLIFIDSVHEYEFLKTEFKGCERIIKQGGIIVLHDAYIDGVRKWADELRKMSWFEVVKLDTLDDIGVNRGIIVIRCLSV